MKTSLGIWALGPMITRFVPGGYQPERARSRCRTRCTAPSSGLGDLMDDYEFHYPGELNHDNLDEVRAALGGHGIYAIAGGLHVDPRFGKGGLTTLDDSVRARRCGFCLEAADLAGEIGAQMIVWPGRRGLQLPVPGAIRRGVVAPARRDRADGGAARENGRLLFLEHKNSEPAMKIHMSNIGMTLHVIHKLRERGIDNVKVNMDWQHLIMNGEHLPSTRRCSPPKGLLGPPARERRLGHIRRRQHGGHDPRSWRRWSSRWSCAARTTARTASGSASTSTRTPRIRSRR